jgi:hypothetical protein
MASFNNFAQFEAIAEKGQTCGNTTNNKTIELMLNIMLL